MGKTPEKVHKRTYYGPLRAWEREPGEKRSELTGRGHLNIMYRRNVRINLNVELFMKGSWPWFNKKNLMTEATINIPIWVILDAAEELRRREASGELRIRSNGGTVCRKRRYKQG